MTTRGVPWTPVYKTGCGWRDCPECGPLIELEIETTHRRRVENTYMTESAEARMSAWSGDMHGTGERRSRPVITLEERRAARGTQAKYRDVVRVKRTLRGDARKRAFTFLATRKVARMYMREGRAVWEAEVWLELTNPTKTIATREKGLVGEKLFEKAVHRAEKLMWSRYKEEAKFIPHPEMRRK